MGGGAGGPAMSWRAVAAAALALWLVPAVLALAILWLPLLCCAVAAVRFLRVRRKLVVASSSSRRSSRGCCDVVGGDDDRVPEETTVDAAGGRLRLLHQYLDDQMELVVVGGHAHDEEKEQGYLSRPASSCC